MARKQKFQPLHRLGRLFYTLLVGLFQVLFSGLLAVGRGLSVLVRRALQRRYWRRDRVAAPKHAFKPASAKSTVRDRRRIPRFIVTALLTFIFTTQFAGINLWFTPRALAAPQLIIEPISWDFIGLDSNNPVGDGPNTFVVGARVCNVGTSDATNVVAKFVKDGIDNAFALVNVQGTDTLSIPLLRAPGPGVPNSISNYIADIPSNGSLRKTKYTIDYTPGNCSDFYYNVVVTRTASAHNTAQRYYIYATADGVAPVVTPRPRQLYIEKILSQARNYVYSFTGPSSVTVGDTVTYVARAHTATAYPQLTFTADFPNIVFQTLNVHTTYSNPGGSKNSTIYADACGFISDPTDLRYHRSSSNCEGEVGGSTVYTDQYPYGSTNGGVGNEVETTYTIKVLSTGSGNPSSTAVTVSNLVLDFSGGSYHYNADYGSGVNLMTITVNQPTPADISIDKSHVGNFGVGENVYTLTITNNGAGTAKAPIQVTDTLPTGYSYVGLDTGTSSGWTCAATGQTVNCTNSSDMASGAVSTIKMKVNVSASAATNTTNTATVSSSTTDNNLANNTDSDPTTVLSGANLSLTKTDGGASFTVGSTGTYTLAVTNNGDKVATGPITLVDTLPTGLTYSSASSSDPWSCSASGQIVTCTLNQNLAVTPATGSSSTLNLTVNVGDSAATIVTNTATVSSATYDPSNNTASDTTPINRLEPDLKITKTHTGTFANGVDAQYTITVQNIGLAATTGVITVTDTLPSALGMFYRSHAETAWTCTNSGGTACSTNGISAVASNSGTLTFTYNAPLLPGQSLTLTPTVRATVNGTANNVVNVTTANDNNGQGGSNSASDPTTVATGSVDLIVSKAVTGTAPTQPGQAIQYTITLLNNTGGNGQDSNISFQDTVPAGITGVTWSCTFGGTSPIDLGVGGNTNYNSCTGTGDRTAPHDEHNLSGNTNTINISTISLRKASNNNRGTVVITVNGTVSSSFLGNLVNTATLTPSAGVDSAPTDNTSTATTSITNPNINLTIAKTHTDPLTVGVSGTYTITVTNTGTSPTVNPIQVVDDLPDSFTYVSATSGTGSSGWTCAQTNSTSKIITCLNSNVLAAGASTRIDLTATPTVAGTNLPNVVTVSTSGEGSANLGNNTATDLANVLAPNVDLSLTKTAVNAPFDIGKEEIYTLTVSNHNVSGATAAIAPITITDTLPTGVSFLYSSSTAGWTCSASGQDVTCTRYSNITPGQSAAVNLHVLVSATASASITNQARVSSSSDVCANYTCAATNNRTSINTTVNPSSDLAITKTVSGTFVVGQTSAYQVQVTNNGPSNYSGTVSFTDTLNNSRTFVPTGSGGGGFSCSAAGQLVTCTKSGGLTAGQTATATINVTPSTAATFNNTADLTSATLTSANDQVTTNNSSTVSTTVNLRQADLVLTKSHFGSFTLGAKGTYTLSVTNNGPASAGRPITITDTLPNNLTLDSAFGFGWTCSGQGTANVSCTYDNGTPADTTDDDLASGTTKAVELIVNVGSGTPTGTNSITNVASATSGVTDPTPANNTNIQDPTTIKAPADIKIEKTGLDTVAAGGSGNYTLTISNLGPGVAENPLYAVDYLPDGLTYTGPTTTGTSVGNGWTIASYNSTSNQVTYTRSSDLASGASTTITVPVSVSNSAPALVTNVADASSSTGDNDPSNNQATKQTTVTGGVSTDLSVNKTDSADPVTFNTNFNYTLAVTNNSLTTDAQDVILTDPLPTGISYVSASISPLSSTTPFGSFNRGCSLNSTNNTVTCTLLTVPKNSTVNVTLTVKGILSGTMTNTASVASSTADSNPANDADTETTTVNPGAGAVNTISGKVFLDNGPQNGSLEGTETGTANVTVRLYRDANNNGQVDSGESLLANTTTNATGDYSFTTTLAGNYVLNIDTATLPSGHTLTTDNVEEADFTTVGNTDSGNNFGHNAPSGGAPELLLVKRITRVGNTNFANFVDDPTDTKDTNSKWPANYIKGELTGIAKPGDEVEYTIYFMNAGTRNADKVRICDRLDSNLTFIPTTYNGQTPTDGGLAADQGMALALGSATPTSYLTGINDAPDRGLFVAAPTVPTKCNITDNVKGVLVVDVTRTTGTPTLTTVPYATSAGTPTESYGFIRFRARIN